MHRPLNIVLIALGSHGDVHPFIGIGIELRKRGHRVSVAAYGHFTSLVVNAGLEPIELGTAEEYRALAINPDLWHRRRGSRFIFRSLAKLLGPVYEAITSRYIPGQTVVAHSTLALGARIAQDKLDVPTVTVHLQPASFRSVIEPAILPGMPMGRGMPLALRRLLYYVADVGIIDPMIAGPINAFREQVGLPPVRRILNGWWNSPRCVIGLFPDWFAPPPPDWPPQTHLTGFPLYDESGLAPLTTELRNFLDAGEASIAFTPGSAMWSAGDFFAESARACVLLGRRGLLLSRHLDHIPKDLPPGVIHVNYAPFSELLPRCAALVHHGGIGTSAQALAAGIPQLVMPRAHDQPDNARRLERLGVARSIAPARYRAARVAATLNELLSPAPLAAAHGTRERFKGIDSIARACDLLETVSDRGSDSTAG